MPRDEHAGTTIHKIHPNPSKSCHSMLTTTDSAQEEFDTTVILSPFQDSCIEDEGD